MLRDECRIGVVEDDPIMGESLIQRLSLEGYKVDWWTTGGDAVAGMRERDPDLVICDVRLPDMCADEVFRIAVTAKGAPPFLFITAYGEIDEAVKLMRAGAGDYMTKPFAMDDFLDRVEGLLCRHKHAPEQEVVLGASAAMRSIARLLRRVADVDTTLLLTGETGVGKEVCARFAHQASERAEQPFMAVNCAAIPSELLESELFGHEKGAFSGAHARHLGYAERAKKGILLLDEVADLPLPLQPKLLRLIQERDFQRVGGERTLRFDARVICSTNQDLERAVERGLFRQDLFYRINVIPVHVPPLRERQEDILPLLHRYTERFASIMSREIKGISTLAEEAALAHDWPGNVRELCNRVERAMALAMGDRLAPGDLFPELKASPGQPINEIATLAQVRDAAEKRQILRALEQTGGKVAMAAELLGVSRTTLWEKMKRLGVSAPALTG